MTWLVPLITSGLSLIGDGVKGFFGVKSSQLENVSKIIDTINNSNMSSAEREKAIMTVVTAEANSGYWLAAVWRPLLMVCLAGIVLAYAMGWTTPNLLSQMPENSMLRELFEILKIGIMGYMPLRTIDKAIESITRSNAVSKLLETLVKNKLK